jgi:hypothetical protein
VLPAQAGGSIPTGGDARATLIEERTRSLDDVLKALKATVEGGLADHERRLTRLETIVEITRPDGGVLRIAPRDGQ